MRLTVAGTVVVGFFVLAAFLPRASSTGAAALYRATAVDASNGGGGSVELVIDRWSTEAEGDRLLETLGGEGVDALDRALKVMPRVGYIRTNDALRFDLRYAHRFFGEGAGEHVVLATERRTDLWQSPDLPRSVGDAFTVIELRLNKDGKGEGKLSLATGVTVDREQGTMMLQHYELQPALLQRVERAHGQR